MKVQTRKLEGVALDWAVAKCEGIPDEDIVIQGWSKSLFRRNRDELGKLTGTYTTGPDLLFSRKREAGGRIIDREGISTIHRSRCLDRPADWFATMDSQDLTTSYEGEQFDPAFMISECFGCYGPTALVAAMRCYVIEKLGEEIEIPVELGFLSGGQK